MTPQQQLLSIPGLLSSAKSAGRGLLDFGRSVGGGLMSGARAVGQNIDAEQLQKDIIDTQRFYQQAMMSQPRQVLGKDLGLLKNITPAGIAASLPSLRAQESLSVLEPIAMQGERLAGLLEAGSFGGVGKEGFDAEAKLRKEFDQSSASYRQALKGFNQVKAAARAENPTGADDVALVFGFMKTIDPGSVVREGEFATAENTAGVPTRVRAAYNKLLSGDRLDPVQREYFLGAARNQFVALQAPQKALEDRYANLSELYQIQPGRVVTRISETFEDVTARKIGRAHV